MQEEDTEIPIPPGMQEWPTLVLKLMLLHAVNIDADALAWTTGSVQVEHYGGLGAAELLKLYGQTLPLSAYRLVATSTSR